jgi:hypothetical protein
MNCIAMWIGAHPAGGVLTLIAIIGLGGYGLKSMPECNKLNPRNVCLTSVAPCYSASKAW